jgi:Aspartyl protease
MLGLISVAFAAAVAAASASPVPTASAAPGSGETCGASSASSAEQSFATPAPVDGLTVDEIMAKSCRAAGDDKTVASEVRFWKLHYAGLDGTMRTTTRGKDFVSTQSFDIHVTSSGSAGGTRWRQNENGEVIVLPSELPDPDVATVSESLKRVTSPVDAYEVETVAANGSSNRWFYDPKTFLIVRSERTAYAVQSYRIYEDFVTDSVGRTFARHIHGGDQRPNNDWDDRLISDDLTTSVSEKDVAVPANRRVLVEFPAGRETVRLPARIVRGAIIVRVQIGERGIDFLLDSGASEIVLERAIAAELGLKIEGQHTETNAGDIASGSARVPEMKIGDLTLHDVAINVLPWVENVELGTKASGILGFDFFDGAAITIDYAKGTVDATAPAAFAPEPGAVEIPAHLTSWGLPQVALTIGPTKGEHFILDTGAQLQSIVIFQHFVRLNARKIPSAVKNGNAGWYTDMVGGKVNQLPIVVHGVTFGGWQIDELHAELAHSPPAFDSIDGLIGSEFLSLFRFTIDEPHGKLYFTPVEDEATPAPVPSPAPSDARR